MPARHAAASPPALRLAAALASLLAAGDALAAPAKRAHVAVGGATVATCLGPSQTWDPAVSRCFPVSPSASVAPNDYVRWVIDVSAGAGAMGLLPVQVADTLTAPQVPAGAGTLAVPGAAASGWTAVGPPVAGSASTLANWTPPAPVASGRMPFNYGANELWAFPTVALDGSLKTVLTVPDPAAQSCAPSSVTAPTWLSLLLPNPPSSLGGQVEYYTARTNQPASVAGEVPLAGIGVQIIAPTTAGTPVSLPLPSYSTAATFKILLSLAGISGSTADVGVPVEVTFGNPAGAPQICFDATMPPTCPAGTTSGSPTTPPATPLNVVTFVGTSADGSYRAAGGFGGELACIPLPVSIAPDPASVPPRGSLTFTASGGSGTGYTWSLTAAPSGGGINAATGVYAAGATGGVTDVVRVTDSLGNVASRSVTVTAGLSISPATASVAPHGSQAFTASGGSGAGFVWTLSTNASGGSITAGGVYTAGATAGVTDVVQVVDSLGNVAARNVTVTAGLTISPAVASAPPRGSLTFTASGGSGTGFTWSLTAAPSGGSISAGGVYTAGGAGGVTDVVQVADSLGNLSARIVTVTAGVTISPAVASTPPRGSLTFAASGGSGSGFSWSLTAAPSGGSINASTGAYTAGATGGVTDVVRVTDSLGNVASRSVTVAPGLTLSPATASVAPRGTQSFTASGGSGTGYAFSLSTNASGGSINASTGAYAAGPTGGVTDVVRVVDSLGNADTSSVTVTAGVAIAPATASVAPRGSQTFTASGGSGSGYAWSLTSAPSGGSINASTGAYTAGATGGVTDVVRVTDSLGNAATRNVTVSAGVTIAPATASLAPRGSQAFTASGGSGTGFVWSLSTSASGGTITSAGVYTAGATGGVTDVVRVVDSLGNTASRNVTVTAGLAIAPAGATVAPRGSQAFTASGGSGTGLVWSLTAAPSGGSITAGGVYTAGGAGGVTDVVQVADSLGNLGSASVTVTAGLSITAPSTTTPPRGQLALGAAGGSGSGYAWSFVTSASGATITAGGGYTAGATPDVTDVVQLSDSLGNTATVTITVGPGVTLVPTVATVPPRGTQPFTASGGSRTGFVWTLTSNPSGGAVTAAGVYTAGVTGNVTDVVRVTDSLGNTATRNVAVTAAVTVAPGALGIPPRGTQAFAASGGSGTGFVWSLQSNGSGGRISPSTGAYTAGGVEGTDVVRVTDSLGNTATATVTVTGRLSITASSTTTPPRGQLSFGGAGGSGTGYAWSLTAAPSGGSINASTGAYAAGATPSVTDVVQLADSLGNTATLAIAVGPGVTIAPAQATVLASGSQAFTAVGGSGTGFSWSLATNASGASVSASGTYAAGPLGGVTDVVQVTDSLGNTATRSVTVVALPRLSLAKSGPASLAAGASGDFTVTLTNQGGSPTTGTLAFQDTLPAGLTFVRQASGAALPCTASAAGLVTCSGAPSVAAGASLAVGYTVSVALDATGPLTNSALVTAAGGDPRPLPSTCSAARPAAGAGSVSGDGLCARWSTALRPGALSVELTLARVNLQAVPDRYQVAPGDLLEYLVQVTETSGLAGAGGRVTATVPESTVYTGLGQGWSSGCAGPATSCTHDFALAAGRTVGALFTVQVAGVLPDGLRALTSAVTASGAACASCSVTTPTAPKLALTVSSPPLLPLGGSSLYAVAVSNRGGSATSGPVAFSDLLPEGLSFSSQLSGEPAFTCSSSGRTVTCTSTAALPPDGAVEVGIGVLVDPRASGNLTSTASLTQLGGDPRRPNCDAVLPAPGQSSQSTDGTCALATGSALSGEAVEFSGGSGCGCTQGRPGLEGLALALAALLGPALRRRRRA